jgi:hypothetical protein
MRAMMLKLIVICAVMCAAGPCLAAYTMDFDVNTSSLASKTGYLELQFNPGMELGPATAVVSNFRGAPISEAAILTGAVTGDILSTLTLNNTNAWNDYFQHLTFGQTLHFSLNLSGNIGNTFALSFFGTDQITPLLTNDPNGLASVVDFNANGVAINSLSKEVNVTPTPIPAAAYLLGTGLIGLIGLRRNGRRSTEEKV